MNYYRFFPGDYARDTAHLTLIQHGAFRIMLDTYYATGKPLPADKPTLYRITRATTAEECAAVDAVASAFFMRTADGTLVNAKAEELLAHDRDKIEKAKHSANAKWNKRPHMRTHEQTHMQTDMLSSSSSISNSDKKETPGKRAITSVQVEIPKALDTEPFRNIWQEWQAYRKPLGGVKDWGKLWIRQLGELEKWGEAAAIKSLRDAMTQGWRGFFEPKVNGKPIQPRPARPEPTKFRDLPEADQKAWREAVLAHSQTLLHKPDLSDPAAVNDLLQDAAGTCRAFHRGDWVAHTRDLRAKMAGGAK